LIERLKKAKQECEMLLRKMDEVESKEKVPNGSNGHSKKYPYKEIGSLPPYSLWMS
jgi:hypothetical protein